MIIREFSKPQEGDVMRKSILLLAVFFCVQLVLTACAKSPDTPPNDRLPTGAEDTGIPDTLVVPSEPDASDSDGQQGKPAQGKRYLLKLYIRIASDQKRISSQLTALRSAKNCLKVKCSDIKPGLLLEH